MATITRDRALEIIREEAAKRGIDPDVAVRVAAKEGLRASPAEAFQSTVRKNGVREQSYGVFQLNRNGVGSGFSKTGYSLSDTSEGAERARIQAALDYAAKNGWGAWYGTKTTNDGTPAISTREGLSSATVVSAATPLPRLRPDGTGTATAYAPAATATPAEQAASAQAGTSVMPPLPSPGFLSYTNQGAIRDMPASMSMTDALAYAAQKEGVSFRVNSGGQPSTGSDRTGSHRHDNGGAVDTQIIYKGRPLDMTNPADRPKITATLTALREAGMTGFGASPNYMGSTRFHVGGGTPAAWGAGGQAANAPSWLSEWFSSTANVAPVDVSGLGVPTPRLAARTSTAATDDSGSNYSPFASIPRSLPNATPVPATPQALPLSSPYASGMGAGLSAPQASDFASRVSPEYRDQAAALDRTFNDYVSGQRTVPGQFSAPQPGGAYDTYRRTQAAKETVAANTAKMPQPSAYSTLNDILKSQGVNYGGGPVTTAPPVSAPPVIPATKTATAPVAVPLPKFNPRRTTTTTAKPVPVTPTPRSGGLVGSLWGTLGKAIAGGQGGLFGLLNHPAVNMVNQLPVSQQTLGQNYGGYTPTALTPANFNPTQGGSQYDYTTGYYADGTPTTSYTTESGRTYTFSTNPDGTTRYY